MHDGEVTNESTREFLTNFLAEYHQHVVRVLTVLPRQWDSTLPIDLQVFRPLEHPGRWGTVERLGMLGASAPARRLAGSVYRDKAKVGIP